MRDDHEIEDRYEALLHDFPAENSPTNGTVIGSIESVTAISVLAWVLGKTHEEMIEDMKDAYKIFGSRTQYVEFVSE